MAITINWQTKVITVPRADMSLVQSSPTEIRELEINSFRLALKDLEDDPDGMPFLQTHNHNTEVSIGGLTLARVVEIINGYTVTFENGQYAVNLVGANSNIGDKVNVNEVSVRTFNSAGLTSSPAIEYSSFGGHVIVDTTSAYSGTLFPIGTEQAPVNNITDAIIIAEFRGFKNMLFRSDVTIGDFDLSGYEIEGRNITNTSVTIEAVADVTKTSFLNMELNGTLDGEASIENCQIDDLSFFNGEIKDCILAGTITLGGGVSATILNCFSGIAGTNTPTINMGGSGQSLALRNYNGGIEITNKTGTDEVSVDLNSGQIIIDDSCTNGTILLRGTGKWTNRETYSGGANVVNELADGLLIQQLDHTTFNEVVSIDTVNGTSGTTFPTGTSKQPVDNLADALLISGIQGIDTLEFSSDYTFVAGENVSLKKLQSGPSSNVTFTFDSGSITAGTRFERCSVQGTLISPSSFDKCDLFDITGNTIGVAGTMNLRRCLFNGEITLSSSLEATINIVDCSSAGPFNDGSNLEDNPIFNANGANVDVAIRGYSGGMSIQGVSNSQDNNMTIDMNSGRIFLDESNTLGSIIIRGIANLTDNSNGATVETEGLIFPNELQLSSFGRHVALSPATGVPGTKFPIGTDSNPVNNLADAKLILAEREISSILLTGTLVVGPGDDISDISFAGTNSLSSVVAMAPTCVTERAYFRDMIITGTINGSIFCENTGLSNVINIGSDDEPTVLNECILLEGTVGLRNGLSTPKNIQIADCVAGVSSGTGITFDYNGSDSLVAFRKFSGCLKISNHTVAQESAIEFDAGDLVIENSCTDGTVLVRGVASITDNSTGTFTLDTTSLLNPADVAQVKKKTATLPIVIPAT